MFDIALQTITIEKQVVSVLHMLSKTKWQQQSSNHFPIMASKGLKYGFEVLWARLITENLNLM